MKEGLFLVRIAEKQTLSRIYISTERGASHQSRSRFIMPDIVMNSKKRFSWKHLPNPAECGEKIPED